MGDSPCRVCGHYYLMHYQGGSPAPCRDTATDGRPCRCPGYARPRGGK